MIRCPACGNPYPASPSYSCPKCGFAPQQIGNILAWAPEAAARDDGFDPTAFAYLAEREARHFWFQTRNALIIWALRTYYPDMASLLEIGCGTGFVLSGVAQSFPDAALTGTEIFPTGLEFAAKRTPTARFMQMDARNLPFDEEFDVIGAFDVIEHIEDDERVLRELHKTLKPGGGLLITVPQHTWLWSAADIVAHHKRRYNADELHAKVSSAGFEIQRSTSFVCFLLPLLLLSRAAARRNKAKNYTREFEISPVTNAIFAQISNLEAFWIRHDIDFPLGGSRLLIATKDKTPANNHLTST